MSFPQLLTKIPITAIRKLFIIATMGTTERKTNSLFQRGAA